MIDRGGIIGCDSIKVGATESGRIIKTASLIIQREIDSFTSAKDRSFSNKADGKEELGADS